MQNPTPLHSSLPMNSILQKMSTLCVSVCVCVSTTVSNSHLLCLSFFACVLVRPSKPRCSIEGSPYFGNEVVLKCKSADGTSPMQYSWEKTTDSKLLPANAVLGKKMKASSPSYCREK